jgi:hypothetical protein
LKEKNMMKSKMTFSGAAALVLGAGVLIASVAPASAQEWRPRHAHHTWWGPAAVAGGIVGGAVAAATSPLWAPGGYGYGPDYGYGPGYYGRDYAYGNGPYDYDAGPPLAQGPAVVEERSAAIEEPMGDSVAYCEAHFKSYDPSSGTYLGYDGVRHSCP